MKIAITGATGDIAQELVKKLNHHELILLSRNFVSLKAVYGQLDAKFLDYRQLDEVGEIDILINNAGFAVFDELSNLTETQIDEMFQVNVIDVIKLTKRLQPKVQLINIASSAGKLPTAKSTIYAATKAAVLAFSDALRMENPNLKILTVNTGPVKTKFHAANPDYLTKVGKNVISAEFVAAQIVKNLNTKKRELWLPRKMLFLVKFRALFPIIFDKISIKFYNYK